MAGPGVSAVRLVFVRVIMEVDREASPSSSLSVQGIAKHIQNIKAIVMTTTREMVEAVSSWQPTGGRD